MTAVLLSHFTREPVAERLETHVINDGDLTTIFEDQDLMRRPAGQLWDRVAESAVVTELGRELSKLGDL